MAACEGGGVQVPGASEAAGHALLALAGPVGWTATGVSLVGPAHAMPTMIQIRNVPKPLHRRLKARAAIEGFSMSRYILREMEKALERPSRQELLETIGSQPEPDLNPSPDRTPVSTSSRSGTCAGFDAGALARESDASRPARRASMSPST